MRGGRLRSPHRPGWPAAIVGYAAAGGLPDMDGLDVTRRLLAGTPEEPEFALGPIRVDLARRQVFVEGEEKHLTPTEYRLFAALVRHAGKVLTHQQLVKEAWGAAYASETHYLRVYMGQLRHKLDPDPARPRYLVTEAGVGYRLRIE